MAMCKRIGVEKEVAAVGGVAHAKGLIRLLEEVLGFEIRVPDTPQTVAALGAAFIAYLPFGKLKHIFNVPLTYFLEEVSGIKKVKRV